MSLAAASRRPVFTVRLATWLASQPAGAVVGLQSVRNDRAEPDAQLLPQLRLVAGEARAARAEQLPPVRD